MPFLVAMAVLTGILGVTGCHGGGSASHLEVGFSLAPGVASQLPSELVFTDEMGSVLVAPLTNPLELGDGPGVELRALQGGEIAYWPAAPALVVVLVDGFQNPPEGGLIPLGMVTDDLGELRQCRSECVVRPLSGPH